MNRFNDFFQNKVAFVSGAASGIGAAVARALAQHGAKLVLADRNKNRLDDLLPSLEKQVEVLALEVDVASFASMEQAIDAGMARFSRMDFAVNSAGIDLARCPIDRYSPDDWNRIIAVNLTGVFNALRCQLPVMRAGGAIVNVSSLLGHRGFRGQPAYTAAKHGVVGLTKAAALDHAGQNIRINAVAPGFIDTPLLGHLDAQAKQTAARQYPMQRLGSAHEVSQVILFLLSDAASFVTGTCYAVDGGALAQ